MADGIGKHLLQNLLSEPNKEAKLQNYLMLGKRGVTEDFFFEQQEKALFRWLNVQYRAYNSLPSLAVAAAENEYQFYSYETDDPFDYWLDTLVDRYTDEYLTEAIASLATIHSEVGRKTTKEARDTLVHEISQKLKSLSDICEGTDRMGALGRQILDQHSDQRRERKIPGIKFGLKFLDAVTGGAQPGDLWVFSGDSGVGKCLGKGTPVLMYDGTIKPVEDVQVGELLMGPDSTPRTVLSLARGREEMYKVIPTKGDAYTVNKSHILSLSDRKSRQVRNISVKDWLKTTPTFKSYHKGWRTGVVFSEKCLPDSLPPYLLGLWLGDGTSIFPEVSNSDPEVVSYLHQYASEKGGKCKDKNKDNHRSMTWCLTGDVGKKSSGSGLAQTLRDFDLIGSKHIPAPYKCNTERVRLEVLAGIIDTDGSLAHGCYDIVQKSEQLSKDIVFLSRSLGLAAYMKKCTKKCYNNGKTGEYFRITISGDIARIPCKVARRLAGPRLQVKDVLVTGIKVESIGEGDYYGFEIDGDRLFMLGDFTVTHNTLVSFRCALGAVLGISPEYMKYTTEGGIRQLTQEEYEDMFNRVEAFRVGVGARGATPLFEEMTLTNSERAEVPSNQVETEEPVEISAPVYHAVIPPMEVYPRRKVLYVSMEMSNFQIAQRGMALGAQIDGTELRMGGMSTFAESKAEQFLEWWKQEKLDDRLVLIEGNTSMYVESVVDLINTHKPDCVFVDGAYMLRPQGSRSGAARHEDIIKVVETLKRAALEFRIPIIATFQFNQTKKEKEIQNIMGGQAIGQTASVVVGLVKSPNASPDTFTREVAREMDLLKGRNGERGRFELLFDMRQTKVTQGRILENQALYESLVSTGESNRTTGPAEDPNSADSIENRERHYAGCGVASSSTGTPDHSQGLGDFARFG